MRLYKAHKKLTIALIALVCVVTIPFLPVLSQVTGTLTVREILNRIYNPDTQQLMSTAYVNAQTTQLTETEIWNLVYDSVTNSFRVSGAAEVEITADAAAELSSCTPFTPYRVTDAPNPLDSYYRCDQTGTTLEKTAGVSGTSETSSTAIETTPTTVVTFKPQVTTFADNAALCKHFAINAETRTTGVSLQLPLLSNTECSKVFHVSLESGSAPFTLTTQSGEFINNGRSSQQFTGAGYAYALVLNHGTRWRVIGTTQSADGSFVVVGGNNTLTGNNIFSGTSTFNNDAIFTEVFNASAATSFLIRKGAGLADTAEGAFGLNTTGDELNYGTGSANWAVGNYGLNGQDTSASNIICSAPGTVRYSPPFGVTLSATDSTSRRYIPRKKRFKNLYAQFGAVPASQQIVLALRINGSNTAITCTGTATQTSCSDPTNIVDTADGDLAHLSITCSGGTTSFGPIDWSIGAL